MVDKVSEEDKLRRQYHDLRFRLEALERENQELKEQLAREIAFKEDYLWVIREMRKAVR